MSNEKNEEYRDPEPQLEEVKETPEDIVERKRKEIEEQVVINNLLDLLMKDEQPESDIVYH